MGKKEDELRKLKSEDYVTFKPEDITPGACHIFKLGDRKIAVCKERDDTIKIFIVEKEHS